MAYLIKMSNNNFKLAVKLNVIRAHVVPQVHLAGRPVAADVDLRAIAFETTKYTGAQLANLVNTAGGFVGKAGRDVITTADLLHVRASPCGIQYGMCSAQWSDSNHRSCRRTAVHMRPHICIKSGGAPRGFHDGSASAH